MSAAAAFHERAAAAVRDERLLRAVHLATLNKVDQRAAGMAELRDPEALRDLAAAIKQHTLERLPDYLEQFAAAAEAHGARLHFAPDAAAAVRIIRDIATAAGAKLVVKAKSMTTEEVHLNPTLEAAGLRVVETDLGEFIVQIDRDRPSHIVAPIIHKDRRQIAQAMQRELGCRYTEEPRELTQIARDHLRDAFRRADFGITGVNFAAADTGTLVICTNEGNGRMCVTRPRVHVALLGIEKLVPRLADVPVFLKLLARGSTGQPLTVYTTLISGPRRADEPDGPDALHIVLLDNGRSPLLGGELMEMLRCIRCGACLNACPVYRNIGGHAYDSVYPGPIGSLVTPLLSGLRQHAELPRASSLCGACYAACPVKIDIPALLVKLRAMTTLTQPLSKRVAMWAFAWTCQTPEFFAAAQWLLRRATGVTADGVTAEGWARRGVGPLAAWMASRDLPAPAAEPFRALWRRALAADQGFMRTTETQRHRET